MNLNKLHEIFKSIVKKQEDKIDPVRSQYGNIEKDEVDMDIKMLYVEAYAREQFPKASGEAEQQNGGHRYFPDHSGADEDRQDQHQSGKYIR